MTHLHQRKRSNSSLSDEWYTPEWLFESLCAIYNFDPSLDICATEESTKCFHWLDKENDALTNDWLIGGLLARNVWCNPPNSKLSDFIRKAYEQYKKHDIDIMMIIPTNSMSSNAFWDSIENPKRNGEPIFYHPIYKRIQFLENGKKPKHSARNAYLVVIWGRHDPLEKP